MDINDNMDLMVPELKLEIEEEQAITNMSVADAEIFKNENFSEEEIAQINAFAEKVNLYDTNAIISYGSGAQQRLADFSDSALKSVRTKDTNEIGDIISGLVADLKFDPDEKRGLAGLFRKGANKVENIRAHYAKVGKNIESVSGVLEKHEAVLLKDVAVLDRLFEKNKIFYKELSMYIAAGKIALNKALNEELPKLQAIAEESGKPEDAQTACDYGDMCERFDKKLNDLAISRTICIQNAPQIRLVQSNDIMMSDKIHSTLVNVIPLWKNQMVLALGMAHSEEAIKTQTMVSNATNDLLRKNAEILHTTTVETAKENERSIVDMETLQHTNNQLIATLDELIQIQEEGREKRRSAEMELTRIENELRDKIVEVSARRS